MRHFVIAAAIAVSTTTATFASIVTDAYSSFIILGDSLSDNGNLFATNPAFVPSPPYVDGRFSNGPVWNEGIASEYAPGTTQNFAFGGATTSGGGFAPPSLDEQALALLGSLPALNLGTTPLVSVWAGANDIRGAVRSSVPVDVSQTAIDAANNVATTIGTLSGLGFNNFLVFNLPDLGATAEANLEGYGAIASPATALYNTTLSANLAALETGSTNIIEVDIASLFEELIASPSNFGVDNATEACVFNPGTCDPAKWLFWDGIHPTAFGHGLVQDQARAAIAADLAPVPLPASAPLMIAGFALLGWQARRRAAA